SSRWCASARERRALTLSELRAPQPVRLTDGAAAARHRAAAVDGAIAELTREALGNAAGISVVAVGGYGRGDLSPHSDIDLLFLTAPSAAVNAATLRGMLYPLWDAGFQVGHATRPPKETIARAASDLDAATAILSARMVAGDPAPFDELLYRRTRFLKKEGKRLARRIVDATAERHRAAVRGGWSLAPDLKDDVGGLRDVHALGWLSAIANTDAADHELDAATELFLAAREALHAESKRKLDRLRIDLQPAVARRLGLDHEGGADEVMTAIHSAARTIEQTSQAGRDALAERILGGPKRSGSVRSVGEGITVQDGVIVVAPADNAVALDRTLRALATRSQTGRPIGHSSLEWMTAALAATGQPRWSEEMREAFFDMLTGPSAAAALEAADQIGAWRPLMPEWLGIRGRAQHDPYHRYTVDGHSFLAIEELSRAIAEDPLGREAARDAGDLRTLFLGTLLHDVGKGSGEDHSIAGGRLAAAVCERMGLAEEDKAEVVFLVTRHLLLVDTATRRDLEDPAVVGGIAEELRSTRLLRLLLLLSIADGRATGPQGWSDWKAALVGELWRKTSIAIETGTVPARDDAWRRARTRAVESLEPALAGRVDGVLETLPPSYFEAVSDLDIAADVRLLLQPGDAPVRYRVDEADDAGHVTVTLVLPDRHRTLARTAGVFTLHRISVLRAQAYSISTGHALERFTVASPDDGAVERFVSDLDAVYSNRLSVEARVARKVSDYRPDQTFQADVRILQDESEHSTVIEVRAPDALGLLYAITAGLSDLYLDIHVAKIDTLGSRVVDVFYVRTSAGTKLDEEQAAEVARSIEHRISELFT
ncbi:MAG TPA: [protein-PII] uridylyltransferase, partial [Actinomycetota bacterium]